LEAGCNGWLSFYVQAVLPLTSFFAVITFITSQGTFSRLSMTDVLKLVFMGINIILPILTYIEIKKLSLRSYYLNIALLCFEPARYLVMVAAQGGAISMSTHIYYLIWTTLNLMYFKNRKKKHPTSMQGSRKLNLNLARGFHRLKQLRWQRQGQRLQRQEGS